MVDIQERYALSYAGGEHVPIPPTLLHSASDGAKFLKLRPSHRTICKLVCGKNLDIFKRNANPSIAGSAALQRLKEQLLETLRASVASKSEEAAAAFFEDASSNEPRKTKFQKVDDAPETIQMVVNGKEVVFLTPSNAKTTDLVVKLDPVMLQAVLDVLAEDVESCFSTGSKRQFAGSFFQLCLRPMDDPVFLQWAKELEGEATEDAAKAMPPAAKKKAKLPSPPVQELSALDRLMMAGGAVEPEEGLLEAKTEEDDDKTDPPSNPAEPDDTAGLETSAAPWRRAGAMPPPEPKGAPPAKKAAEEKHGAGGCGDGPGEHAGDGWAWAHGGGEQHASGWDGWYEDGAGWSGGDWQQTGGHWQQANVAGQWQQPSSSSWQQGGAGQYAGLGAGVTTWMD
ncbi:unnamed protein product, partial [Symbiodinium microadriaticum]